MKKKICSVCGSEDVLVDAYAKWNSDKGGYDYGNSESNEMSFGGSKPSAPVDPQANAEEDDDMPF